MFGIGTTELVIIMIIVLLIFGGAKLRTLGSDLGGGIKEFKDSIKGDDSASKSVSEEAREDREEEAKDDE